MFEVPPTPAKQVGPPRIVRREKETPVDILLENGAVWVSGGGMNDVGEWVDYFTHPNPLSLWQCFGYEVSVGYDLDEDTLYVVWSNDKKRVCAVQPAGK